MYNRYDQWWTVKLHDVEYGGNDIKDSGIGYAILDTGTSLLYLGEEDYVNFEKELLKAVPELDCSSNIYCFSNDYYCDELTPRMKPLMINLQENYYTLPAEAYTFSRDNIFQKKCTVAISWTSDSGGVYILGDTFLRNFVTTFDFANGEMRLAINKNAPAGVSIDYKMGGWKIFGIIVGGLVGLALIIVFLVYCICKCKKNKAKAKGYSVIQANADKEEVICSERLTSARTTDRQPHAAYY